MQDPLAAAALESLLKGTRGAVLLLVDRRLRIRRAGEAAASLAERPAHSLPGMSLIAALGSVELDRLARAAAAAGEAMVGEAQLGRRGRTFGVEAVPVAGGGLAISLYDITRLRRAERARRDFVANISHELRTPLASIKLLAETLAAGAVEDPSSARDFADQIGRETDHLVQLVDELLDLARIESGEVALSIEPVSPQATVLTLADRIGPVAARSDVRVRILPAAVAPEPMAAADPERLGQALLNLAHNAVKYSRAGGEVRLGWRPIGAAIRFEVSDDGIGVPAAHQARIFERFYKVERARGRREADGEGRASAGLGLAIVRHIAEAHGGATGVTSTEGIGSTFWVEVPTA